LDLCIFDKPFLEKAALSNIQLSLYFTQIILQYLNLRNKIQILKNIPTDELRQLDVATKMKTGFEIVLPFN